MATFVRFQCPGRDGIFATAAHLAEAGALPERDRRRLRRTLEWFQANLPVPDRFVRTTSKGFYRRPATAICWFRDDATRHLKRAWLLANTLRRNDVIVEFIRTRHPGYITYEDRHQLVAIPFADR